MTTAAMGRAKAHQRTRANQRMTGISEILPPTTPFRRETVKSIGHLNPPAVPTQALPLPTQATEAELLGLEQGFCIHGKERLDSYVNSRILCWLVRRLYDLCGISGNFRTHFLGIIIYEEVAREIVTNRNREAKNLKPGDKWYGFVFEVVELPVSRLLDAPLVRYGTVEYSGADLDARLRAREPTNLVDERSACVDRTFDLLRQEIGKTKAAFNATVL